MAEYQLYEIETESLKKEWEHLNKIYNLMGSTGILLTMLTYFIPPTIGIGVGLITLAHWTLTSRNRVADEINRRRWEKK